VLRRRCLLDQDASDLAARSEQKQADAGAREAGDLGDFAVRVPLCMSQPQLLPIAWAHLR
jgi:hypothetical protein